MKKKILALLLACVMVMGLTACGGNDNSTAADNSGPGNNIQANDNSGPGNNIQPADNNNYSGNDIHVDDSTPSDGGQSFTVGICQLAPHPALDAATQGFKDALTEKLGGSVEFKEGNAGGESNNCIPIVDGFISENVDLILANATSPLQTAASATSTIPVLGTSVTDYATALGIENWTGTVGSNVSGTSDLAPLEQQAEMLHEMFPEAKNVGMLYCSGEPNSVYQVEVVTAALEGMGYTCANFAFTDANDITSVTQSACDSCDVIYVPTDNTAANNTEAIANVVIPAGVPVVAGEEGICSGCGVVTLSISYYDIGHIAGEMAYDILANGADVTTMPVQFAPEVTKKYNAANCEALQIAVPDDYEAIG